MTLLQDDDDDFFGAPTDQETHPLATQPSHAEGFWKPHLVPQTFDEAPAMQEPFGSSTLPHHHTQLQPNSDAQPSLAPSQTPATYLPSQTELEQHAPAAVWAGVTGQMETLQNQQQSLYMSTAGQAMFMPHQPPSSESQGFSSLQPPQQAAQPQLFNPAQQSTQAQPGQPMWPPAHASVSQPQLQPHTQLSQPYPAASLTNPSQAMPTGWPLTDTHLSQASFVQPDQATQPPKPGISPTALPSHSLAVRTQAVSSPLSPGPLQPVAQQPYWGYAGTGSSTMAFGQPAEAGYEAEQYDQSAAWPEAEVDEAYTQDFAYDQQGDESGPYAVDASQQDLWAQQAQHAAPQTAPQQGPHAGDAFQQDLWAQHAQHAAPQAASQHGLFGVRAPIAPHIFPHQPHPQPFQPQIFRPHTTHRQTTSSSPFAPSPGSAQLYTPFAATHPQAQAPFPAAYPPTQTPFAAATTSGAEMWNPMHGSAAVMGNQYLDQDCAHRSPDGRPACALLSFGFAGKLYLWQPQGTPALTCTCQACTSEAHCSRDMATCRNSTDHSCYVASAASLGIRMLKCMIWAKNPCTEEEQYQL